MLHAINSSSLKLAHGSADMSSTPVSMAGGMRPPQQAFNQLQLLQLGFLANGSRPTGNNMHNVCASSEGKSVA